MMELQFALLFAYIFPKCAKQNDGLLHCGRKLCIIFFLFCFVSPHRYDSLQFCPFTPVPSRLTLASNVYACMHCFMYVVFKCISSMFFFSLRGLVCMYVYVYMLTRLLQLFSSDSSSYSSSSDSSSNDSSGGGGDGGNGGGRSSSSSSRSREHRFYSTARQGDTRVKSSFILANDMFCSRIYLLLLGSG